MAYLTYLGADAGPPDANTITPSAAVIAQGKAAVAEFYLGRAVVAQSGCEACHKIGGNGNNGPGPELTHIADRAAGRRRSRARSSTRPQPMPSFAALPPKQFAAAVAFLSDLK